MIGEVCVFYLLSGFECDVIVLSSIVWINFCKVKSLREEIVNQRTKCNTIGPITCKVFKFDLKLYHSKLFFQYFDRIQYYYATSIIKLFSILNVHTILNDYSRIPLFSCYKWKTKERLGLNVKKPSFKYSKRKSIGKGQ